MNTTSVHILLRKEDNQWFKWKKGEVKVEYKHLPKFVKAAIPIINIAGLNTPVSGVGMLSDSGKYFRYEIVDPVLEWQCSDYY